VSFTLRAFTLSSRYLTTKDTEDTNEGWASSWMYAGCEHCLT
jgi:hypothetical protein